jgi:hypothetical protein
MRFRWFGNGLFALLLLGTKFAILGCAARRGVDPAFTAGDSGIAGQLVRTRLVGGKVEAIDSARGTVLVRGSDLADVAARVDTDANGGFQIGLRPGNYFVYTETQELGPYGRRVSVGPHQMTRIQLDLPPGP